MNRLYQSIIEEHLGELDQMIFMPGPRQVGKTTIVKKLCENTNKSLYLNWDLPPDREIILKGPQHLIKILTENKLHQGKAPLVALDEIHKFKDWKNYLKGYFDYTKSIAKTIVTGSAKLDVYKRGGDSLMGRYFLYHAHPFSVGEILARKYKPQEIQPPKKIDDASWDALYEFGGFPEPLFKQDKRFYTRWQQLRFHQLLKEDIQELSDVSDLALMEMLAKLIQNNAAKQVNYHQLAKMVQISDKTAKNWINILKSFYFCFTLQPWTKNISRSLIKEPKVYLWDWSNIEDKDAKVENFIASHLLKAVHYWTDIGLGNYQLYYLRDKDKREVDFLISKNDQPWIMVEVKSSEKTPLSDSLLHFQNQTQAEHVFQVAFDMPYVDKDCFTIKKPIIVPAKTFLSQLP